MRSRRFALFMLVFLFLSLSAMPRMEVHAESEGIQVIRPAYGMINILVDVNLLNNQLAQYSSLSLRSFDKQELYHQAVQQLNDGSFDHRAFLQRYKLEPNSSMPNEKKPKRLYTHQLIQGGSFLLNKEAQTSFSYIFVLYDASGYPIYYKYAELPDIEVKMSTNPTIVALMYHHFTEKKEEQTSVTVHKDMFRKQLQALKADGFVSIRQQELLAFLKGDKRVKLPEKSVIITIDDGYESNYKLAYPILVQEQFYASIFAVTSYRGKTPSIYPHFTWEQASEMYSSGYVDIQNHTHESHYYGTTTGRTRPALISRLIVNNRLESQFVYEKRIYNDMKKAKSLIEQHIGNKVIALTYPYGSYNQTVINKAAASGHSLMYTIKEGVIRKGSNPHALPRINVDGKYSAKAMMDRIYTHLR
ncbi:polysaccharide deacetylase family protein [Paenibacillus alkaliterrae]|uniref:polysaccharide deacetylase family protein n=1 Tax=Paenibacillus alkaliterrae TaxID=320909 RepID=UPI001F32763D|nr:polysaccharide deacetylase family protein [Paenibacillus alkaliterrae]MCF2941783.1 polysaccharide deacetylase family protein [Paenibacillus alkaliterrae]